MSFFFFFRSLFGSFRLEWTVSINGSFFFSFFSFRSSFVWAACQFFYFALFFFNGIRLETTVVSLSLSLSLKRARYVNELVSREL